MAIDASIYQLAGRGVKSIGDYDREALQMEAARQQMEQQRQAGALSTMLGRQKADEYGRGLREQEALRTLMGNPGFDRRAPDATAQVYRAAPGLADSVLKGWGEQDKAAAVAKKDLTEADKAAYALAQSKQRQAVQDISAFASPQDAVASLRAAAARGDIQPQAAQGILSSMPQTPAEFVQWRDDLVVRIASSDPSKFIDVQTTRRGQDQTAATAAAGHQVTRETAAQTDERIRSEGAANRGVQLRGQNMVDNRARQTLEQDGATSPPPSMGLPRPTVLPWANQTNARDANKVKAAEMTRGAKEVEKDDDAAKAEAATAAMAKRFLELNETISTGGVADRFGLGRSVQAAFSAERQEMEAITAKLVPAMRVPGSGSTSDFDAKMFERSAVGIDKKPEANAAIGAGLVARGQMAQDYALFRQSYLEQNGTLQGADRHWQGYVKANPIFDPASQTPKINKDRKGWKDHFAGGAPSADPKPAATAGPKPGAVQDGYRFKGGNPADAKNWEKV